MRGLPVPIDPPSRGTAFCVVLDVALIYPATIAKDKQ